MVAASRYLGRANLAVALRSFMAEGVWGTSPHLIPHFALHSASGTISLALGSHGPNLGVGGGLHAAAEGFLAALTWLASGVVPGVWLVLSGWSPELVPDPVGKALDSGECHGLGPGPGRCWHRGRPAGVPGCVRSGLPKRRRSVARSGPAGGDTPGPGRAVAPHDRDRCERAAAHRAGYGSDGPGG